MYYLNFENMINKIPNIEEIFSVEYLEFYKRHLLGDIYKDELNDFYKNNNISIDSIIFKYFSINFDNFIEEKSKTSLENNYFEWKKDKNNDKAKLFSDNFYYKILDCIINKMTECLDKCENKDNCCNICLEKNNVNFKCNKCNLYYDRDCLIKYILNNFKYFDKNNNKTFYIINYEISCPQCRKYILSNFKINNSNQCYSLNKKL